MLKQNVNDILFNVKISSNKMVLRLPNIVNNTQVSPVIIIPNILQDFEKDITCLKIKQRSQQSKFVHLCQFMYIVYYPPSHIKSHISKAMGKRGGAKAKL